MPPEKKAELLLADLGSEGDVGSPIKLKLLFDEYQIGVPLAVRVAPDLVARSEKLAPLFAAIGRASGLPATRLDEGAWSAALAALARALRAAGIAYLAEATPAEVPAFLRARLAEPDFEGPIETVLLATGIVRGEGAEAMAAAFTSAGPGPAAAGRLLASRPDAAGFDAPICDEPVLRWASELLAGAHIEQRDSETVRKRAAAGNRFCLDPSSDPMTLSACFTSCSSGGFGRSEQERLAE